MISCSAMASSVCATSKRRVRNNKYAHICIAYLGLKFIISLPGFLMLAVDGLSEGKKSMKEKTY